GPPRVRPPGRNFTDADNGRFSSQGHSSASFPCVSLVASEQYGPRAPCVSSGLSRSRDAIVICRNGGCGLWIITTGLSKVADVKAKAHGVSNARFLFHGQMAATAWSNVETSARPPNSTLIFRLSFVALLRVAGRLKPGVHKTSVFPALESG